MWGTGPVQISGKEIFLLTSIKGNCPSFPDRMGRIRVYSAEELMERIRASKRAWAARNRERQRALEAAYRARTGNAEAKREYVRRRYHAKRAALVEMGWVPNPVGRPRLYSEEELRERHRAQNRAYARKRAREAEAQPPPAQEQEEALGGE